MRPRNASRHSHIQMCVRNIDVLKGDSRPTTTTPAIRGCSACLAGFLRRATVPLDGHDTGLRYIHLHSPVARPARDQRP
jgi:hypothetical protein